MLFNIYTLHLPTVTSIIELRLLMFGGGGFEDKTYSPNYLLYMVHYRSLGTVSKIDMQ